MKKRDKSLRFPGALPATTWPPGVGALIGLAAAVWLASVVACAMLKAWAILALLIAVAVIALRIVQVLGYRD